MIGSEQLFIIKLLLVGLNEARDAGLEGTCTGMDDQGVGSRHVRR